MRRGELRWAEHRDWGIRPVLVMTRDEAIDRLDEVCRALNAATGC